MNKKKDGKENRAILSLLDVSLIQTFSSSVYLVDRIRFTYSAITTNETGFCYSKDN